MASWLLHLEILCLDVGLLLSLYAGYRIALSQTSGASRALKVLTPWAVLMLLLFGLALFAKETAIVLPLLIGAYEWIHFLIDTSHRPRSRYYRAIWRNHRLHHFKNEHYWHGITNTISDTVLRTNPDQSTIAKSGTARALHSDGI